MSDFMNEFLRGGPNQVDDESLRESQESIGGKSDAGAGEERIDTSETDMNAFLREAVFESRGRPA